MYNLSDSPRRVQRHRLPPGDHPGAPPLDDPAVVQFARVVAAVRRRDWATAQRLIAGMNRQGWIVAPCQPRRTGGRR